MNLAHKRMNALHVRFSFSLTGFISRKVPIKNLSFGDKREKRAFGPSLLLGHSVVQCCDLVTKPRNDLMI